MIDALRIQWIVPSMTNKHLMNSIMLYIQKSSSTFQESSLLGLHSTQNRCDNLNRLQDSCAFPLRSNQLKSKSAALAVNGVCAVAMVVEIPNPPPSTQIRIDFIPNHKILTQPLRPFTLLDSEKLSMTTCLHQTFIDSILILKAGTQTALSRASFSGFWFVRINHSTDPLVTFISLRCVRD
jgi:hypothetical protein